MKRDILRVLGWLIPAVSMAIAFYIILRQNAAFQLANKTRDAVSIDLAKRSGGKTKVSTAPPPKFYATVPEAPDEESTFVSFLRGQTAAEGVTLTSLTSTYGDYGKDKNLIKDENIAKGLKGIRRITSQVSLSGDYVKILAFILDIEKSDRLYTISNINWSNTLSTTVLRLAIARYVTLPKSDIPPPAQPSGITESQ